MIIWDNTNSPYHEMMSLADAAQIWGIDASTLRKAIADGRLDQGTDCCKYGKQWVITASAMKKFTNDWAPWERYKANCRKHEKGEPNDIQQGKIPIP